MIHLRHTTIDKYDNSGTGWYFQLGDHNKMRYKFILSITYTWIWSGDYTDLL